MIGAGVFAAIGPAAAAAGSGLLVGLAIAAVVAYCNATSSAALAALYPVVRRHLRLRPRTARSLLGLSRRVGLRRRQDGQLRRHRPHRRRLRGAGVAAADRRRRRTHAHRRQLPRHPQDRRAHPDHRRRRARRARARRRRRNARRDRERGALRRPGRRRCRWDPAVRRAAVLRVRRLRPHRDTRRGGRGPRPHDPEGHPTRARHHARRLCRRRRQRTRSRRTRRARSIRRTAGHRGARRRPRRARARRAHRRRHRRARCPALADRRRQPHRVRHGRRSASFQDGSTPSTPPTRSRTEQSSPPARSSRCSSLSPTFAARSASARSASSRTTPSRTPLPGRFRLSIVAGRGCSRPPVSLDAPPSPFTLPVASVVAGTGVLAVGALTWRVRHRRP